MATGDQIRALLKSHADGDDSRFYAVAMQVAAAEARKGHADLAAELQDMIDRAKEGASTGRDAVPSGAVTVPFAAPRGELEELLAVSYPATRLADVIANAELRDRLTRIVEEQRHIALLRGHDLHPRQRLLLTGPPGCGKTLTASALAGELGMPLFVVRLDGLITKYMGETAAKLRLIFEAMERTRAVYLFDEFDSIGTERGHGSDVGEIRRVLNSFLVFIERYRGTSLVVAATNHPQTLDAALFRRFDDLLEFPMPDRAMLREAMKRRMAIAPGKILVKYDRLVREAEQMSFAEAVRACDEAIKEVLIRGRAELRTEDVLRAVRERRAFLHRGK